MNAELAKKDSDLAERLIARDAALDCLFAAWTMLNQARRSAEVCITSVNLLLRGCQTFRVVEALALMVEHCARSTQHQSLAQSIVRMPCCRSNGRHISCSYDAC